MRQFAGVIVRREELILAIHFKPEAKPPGSPLWRYPGGKVEDPGGPYMAACRELKEETGITGVELHLMYRSPQPRLIDGEKWEAFTYLAIAAVGEPKLMEPEKMDCLCWMTPQMLVELSPFLREELAWLL